MIMEKEEAILNLIKVREIGVKTAKCLYGIGVESPEDLANADPANITDAFRRGNPKEGFYKVDVESVNKWILAAKSDNWEYSKAEERYDSIRRRTSDEDVEFNMDREAFRKFYGKDEMDRECAYCGIKESEINKLFTAGRISTKRWGTRGRAMEVDRRDPRKSYVHRGTESNIALCCYWCNNAKTDEFNDNEFFKIAQAIKDVWKKRLEQISKIYI